MPFVLTWPGRGVSGVELEPPCGVGDGLPGRELSGVTRKEGGRLGTKKESASKSVRWGVGINIVPGEGLRLASPQLIPFPLLLVQKYQIVYC